jgi:hypothetical protein
MTVSSTAAAAALVVAAAVDDEDAFNGGMVQAWVGHFVSSITLP